MKYVFHLGRWFYLKGHCQNQRGRILAFQSCFRRSSFKTGCFEFTIKNIN